jgi:hypothetical protein
VGFGLVAVTPSLQRVMEKLPIYPRVPLTIAPIVRMWHLQLYTEKFAFGSGIFSVFPNYIAITPITTVAGSIFTIRPGGTGATLAGMIPAVVHRTIITTETPGFAATTQLTGQVAVATQVLEAEAEAAVEAAISRHHQIGATIAGAVQPALLFCSLLLAFREQNKHR